MTWDRLLAGGALCIAFMYAVCAFALLVSLASKVWRREEPRLLSHAFKIGGLGTLALVTFRAAWGVIG